ncbi:MAG TPA: SRPBCC family protein [Solirubrobacteraceae bacterium]|jgi:hypothetical protein
MTIRARRRVGHPPERVFAFLAELDNHWQLGDRYLRLESVDDDRRGARVGIRTPWGVRRTARTAVAIALSPRRFGGTASIGRRTLAHVWWAIEPRGSAESLVALEATIDRASPLDRVLLALGGRWWLERRFDRAVARLDDALPASGEHDRPLARRDRGPVRSGPARHASHGARPRAAAVARGLRAAAAPE